MKVFTRVAAMAVLLGAMAGAAQALIQTQDEGKRSSFGSDIVINKGENASKVACVFCTVYVHGTVDGEVAVSFGNVVVDGTVDGKVAVFAGNLVVKNGGVVDGKAAVAGGLIDKQPGGTISGKTEQTMSMHAGGVMAVIAAVLLLPLLVLVAIVWLIVWLIRRNRTPMYPPPPGYAGYPPPPAR